MKNEKNQPQLRIEEVKGRGEGEISHSLARHILRPNLNSTATISSFQAHVPHADLSEMLDELDVQTSRIWSGQLGRAEEMLSAQAHTLDAMFNTLAQKAATTMKSGHLPSTEAYLRMALKAQSQCRTTLEALAEIKAPKSATFIRQANIAEQQQVNNGPTVNGGTHKRAHEKNIEDSSDKLLEVHHGERMDSRTTSAAISDDPQLEAVGTVHRPKNRGRQGHSGR